MNVESQSKSPSKMDGLGHVNSSFQIKFPCKNNNGIHCRVIVKVK